MDLTNMWKMLEAENINIMLLSSITEVSSSVIYQWRRGTRNPSLMTISKIADFLNCSIDYLIGRANEPRR